MTRTCATMPHHFELAAASEQYRDDRRVVELQTARLRTTPLARVTTIPVVVHVLFDTPANNVSDAQIASQIRVLNEDFRMRNADIEQVPAPFLPYAADAMVEFVLANRDPAGQPTSGVTRTPIPGPYPFNRNDPDATLKLDALIKRNGTGIDPWPAGHYLNLWVCPIQDGPLGYAQFPGGPPATDGVVVNATAFGVGGSAVAPYDRGRTAVHEVGHWLNLLHIWGDDEGGCRGSDNVSDTPNQAGPNEKAPAFPSVSCANGPHGDMFMNYMDYTDDAAMVMFTRGQVARMTATLLGARASLALSMGYVAPSRVSPQYLLRSIGVGAPGTPKVFDGVDWV